mgnify:CR=1 FL=1|jgi:hypothetical protein
MKKNYKVDLDAYTRGRDDTFSDYEVELIENLIVTFSKILGIKRKVLLVDRDTWIKLDLNDPPIIFLNPRLNICIKEIMDSTIHELIHIRYPKWSEDKVRKHMMNWIPRADKRDNQCALNKV